MGTVGAFRGLRSRGVTGRQTWELTRALVPGQPRLESLLFLQAPVCMSLGKLVNLSVNSVAFTAKWVEHGHLKQLICPENSKKIANQRV